MTENDRTDEYVIRSNDPESRIASLIAGYSVFEEIEEIRVEVDVAAADVPELPPYEETPKEGEEPVCDGVGLVGVQLEKPGEDPDSNEPDAADDGVDLSMFETGETQPGVRPIGLEYEERDESRVTPTWTRDVDSDPDHPLFEAMPKSGPATRYVTLWLIERCDTPVCSPALKGFVPFHTTSVLADLIELELVQREKRTRKARPPTFFYTLTETGGETLERFSYEDAYVDPSDYPDIVAEEVCEEAERLYEESEPVAE